MPGNRRRRVHRLRGLSVCWRASERAFKISSADRFEILEKVRRDPMKGRAMRFIRWHNGRKRVDALRGKLADRSLVGLGRCLNNSSSPRESPTSAALPNYIKTRRRSWGILDPGAAPRERRVRRSPEPALRSVEARHQQGDSSCMHRYLTRAVEISFSRSRP